MNHPFNLKSLAGKLLPSLLIIISLTLAPLFNVFAFNSSSAQTYLKAHASSPWSTMALVALNDISIPSDYLKNISGSNAIDYEAPILAITALNQNPRNFGSTDYIAKLKSYSTGGQIGNSATLNDDVFGILALVSAGEPLSEQTISDSKNFLLAHQNSDGGWGFSTTGSSDSNTTASVIVALTAAGINSSDSHITGALSYIKTAQNNDGGFTYDPTSQYGTDSDSSSTAWVIWAINSLGQNLSAWTKGDHSPSDYLSSTQDQSGYFHFQAGSPEDSFSAVTTAYATIALAGKTLPIHIFNSAGSSETFAFRIEGSQDTVCEGKTAGPTALDVIKNAAATCGFTFHIKSASFGDYLDKINSDEAAGLTGWLYFVNNISPDVGAADYKLKTNNEVLWYFGDYGWQPTRISLQNSTINSGQSTQAKVESFDNGSWSALAGATVNVGTQTFTTNSNGQVNITNQDGYYKIFSSKTGYVRSNKTLLQIGQPSSSTVTLSANITDGQVQGTSTQGSTISFNVNTQSLDFGDLKAGASATKEVTLSNTGSSNLHIESIVSGDSLFVDNLIINSLSWKAFQLDLNSGLNQKENLKLTVPVNYSGSKGQKNGQLVFWASAK